MSSKKTEKTDDTPRAVEKATGGITNEEKNLALVCHLSGLFWFVIPGLNIVIPLIILLVKGADDAFVSHHGRQALIFQVIMSVVMTVLLFLGVILLIVLIGLLFIGAGLVVAALDVIFILAATFAASRGERYSYPLMGGI
jgi:uncharacterized Tic20 family protein